MELIRIVDGIAEVKSFFSLNETIKMPESEWEVISKYKYMLDYDALAEMAWHYLDSCHPGMTDLLKDYVAAEMVCQIRMAEEYSRDGTDEDFMVPAIDEAFERTMRHLDNIYEELKSNDWAPKQFFEDFDRFRNSVDEEECVKLGFDYSNYFYADKINDLTGVEILDVGYSEDNQAYFFRCKNEDLAVLKDKAEEICEMVEKLEECDVALGLRRSDNESEPAEMMLVLGLDDDQRDCEGCDNCDECADFFSKFLSLLPLILDKGIKNLDRNNPNQRTAILTKSELEEVIGSTIIGAENFFDASADLFTRFRAKKSGPHPWRCITPIFESVIMAFDKHKQPFFQFVFDEAFMREFICCEDLSEFTFGVDY